MGINQPPLQTDTATMILQVLVMNLDNNNLIGTLPHVATAQVINITSNHLSSTMLSSLPPALECLYAANNSFTGVLPHASILPVNLTVLDISNNLISGVLPAALPANLTVFNASNNAMTGNLPRNWSRLAELRIDNMQLTGMLPAEWSEWGKNTSNAIQISAVDAGLRGHVPTDWVQQFCLAVVRQSDSQVLYNPSGFNILMNFGAVAHVGVTANPYVPVGSPIRIIAQHTDINLTLGSHLYKFTYGDPDSICLIANAARNAALVWGSFAMLLLTIIVALQCSWRRKRAHGQVSPPGNAVPYLIVLTSVLSYHRKRFQGIKRVAANVWVFLSDVLWFIYSQVTDVVTIKQVFDSDHQGYAFSLLSILLLPYLLIGMLVARLCIKYCLSRASSNSQSGVHNLLCYCAAVVIGVAFFPLVFLALEVGMLLHAVGIPLARWVLPNVYALSTLYRAKSITEAFCNALPQAIIQTKLYIMGNDPNGVHVYIDTSLYVVSVVASLVSVLKTVAFLMVETHQSNVGILGYFQRIVDLVSIDNYNNLQGMQSNSHP